MRAGMDLAEWLKMRHQGTDIPSESSEDEQEEDEPKPTEFAPSGGNRAPFGQEGNRPHGEHPQQVQQSRQIDRQHFRNKNKLKVYCA